MDILLKRIILWIFFNVLVATVPLLWNLVTLRVRCMDITVQGLAGNGELLLISVTIAASAIGEVISKREVGDFKMILVGICVMLIITQCFYYSLLSTGSSSDWPLNRNTILQDSMYLYLSTVVTAFICIAVSGEPE